MGQTNLTHSTVQNQLMSNSQRADGKIRPSSNKQTSHRESGPLKTTLLQDQIEIT